MLKYPLALDKMIMKWERDMFFRSVRSQTVYFFKKKSVAITFFILMALVLCNIFYNFFIRYGSYETQMVSAVKQSVLSKGGALSFYFMVIYPFLAAIPFAGTYLHDKNSQEIVYLRARMSERVYVYSKMVAIFFVSLFLFTFPFLLEIIVYAIFIPEGIAGGDWTFFDLTESSGFDSNLLLSNLYLQNIYLYAAVWILIFGLVSAILEIFLYSVTLSDLFSKKIYTFFPLFILLELSGIIEMLTGGKVITNYSQILLMFNERDRMNWLCYLAFLLFLLVIGIIANERRIKKGTVV